MKEPEPFRSPELLPDGLLICPRLFLYLKTPQISTSLLLLLS